MKTGLLAIATLFLLLSMGLWVPSVFAATPLATSNCSDLVKAQNVEDCEHVLKVDDVVAEYGPEESLYLAGDICSRALIKDRFDAVSVKDCFIAAFVLQSHGLIDPPTPLTPELFAGLGPLIAQFSSCEEALNTMLELAVLMDEINKRFAAPESSKKNCDVLQTMALVRGVKLTWAEAAQERSMTERFPDTYGKLQTPPEFSDAARGIETADSEGFDVTDSIFAGGLVDHLLGYCAVDISVAERTRLAAFVVRSIADARGPITGGDLDEAFNEALQGGLVYAQGAEAASRLDCAEPVSSQLLRNVVTMLD
jgi:hypothetical protein